MGEKATYELSHGQKRFWIQSQLNPGSSELNQPMAVRIGRRISPELLRQALEHIAERHFVLRTVFLSVNGEPRQMVLEHLEVDLPVTDYSGLGLEAGREAAHTDMLADMGLPFDLMEGPLFRVRLYHLDDEAAIFYICLHHIIEDGWSMDVLFRELFTIYQSMEQGTAVRLPDLPIQYIDYAHWQNQLLSSGKLRKQEEYWRTKLGGELPSLHLPLDYARPQVRNAAAGIERIVIEPAVCRALEQMNRRYGTTMFMSIAACLQVLLARLCNQEEILIGTPIAGRNHKHVKNLIGFFVNTLVLRNRLSVEGHFPELLLQVKQTCIEAFEHQDYPFDQLLQLLEAPRRLNRAPLFDVLLNFASDYSTEGDLNGIRFDKVLIGDGAEHNEFDLTVIVETVDDRMIVSLSYGTDLFSPASVRRIGENLRRIIAGVADNAEQRIWEIGYLSDEEQRVLQAVNDTRRVYPEEETIPSLFARQAARTPGSIAVEHQGKTLTYSDLHTQSNRIGHLLRQCGVGPNQPVAVLADRGSALLGAVLGVLKAGGAYVPVDPEYPELRIRYLLHDSACRVLITGPRYLGQLADYLPGSVDIVLCLEEEPQSGIPGSSAAFADSAEETVAAAAELPDKVQVIRSSGGYPATDLPAIAGAADLAYIIYTSGSTGHPKGVMISHRAVLNTLHWLQDTYTLSPEDVVAQKTSASFTDSVWEFFWPLLAGAKLAVLPGETVKDPVKLYHCLKELKISVTQFVPGQMALFLSAARQIGDAEPLNALKWVFNGGEALPANLVREWYALFHTARIANIYGMTESAIYATNYLITDKPGEHQLRIPLGLPIANTHVYVLDAAGQPAGFHVPGEICIGSIGMASGYWNKPELTAQAFKAHPLTGERLYRTGDIGFLRPDGLFEYLGRRDDQIQVRGFRVELKEVERAVTGCPGIAEAAVVAREEQSGTKALVCYYTRTQPGLEPLELREYLKRRLPEYMVPGLLLELQAMPLTPHGKIDRRNLPKPEGRIHQGTDYVPPGDDVEEALATIWQEVLEIGQAGVLDLFFELGGHSLKLAKTMYRIQEQLHTEVTFKELFEHQTIRAQALLIKSKSRQSTTPMEPLEDQDYYAVSAAQRRLYVLQQLEQDSLSNHVFSAWRFSGDVQREQIEAVFKLLIQRHEVLRTGFTLLEDDVYQHIHGEIDWQLDAGEADEIELPAIVRRFLQPFDLKHPPLFRAQWVTLAEEEFLLLLDFHHIVYDGTSAAILLDEFTALLAGRSLEGHRLQYKEFAAWQNIRLTEPAYQEHERYWLGQFDEKVTGKEIPLLSLPADYTRPKHKSYKGGTYRFILPLPVVNGLRTITAGQEATLFMGLLAVFSVWLSRYSGQNDIIVGTPVAGRTHAQTAKMIGTFVNTLALRSHPLPELTFRQFLNEVKQVSLEALEHQDYPFDHLVNRLNLLRDVSRNPLFDVMLRLQNFTEGEKSIPGIQVQPYPLDNPYVPFDLVLTATEMPDGLHCIWEYCTELFTERSAEQMARHFIQLADNLTLQPDWPLYRAKMLTPAEEYGILEAGSGPEVTLPEGRLVHQMFEEQAARRPGEAAVACGGTVLSYGQLDLLSNRLARTLRNKGVKPNTVVGIVVNRSVELITAILAVLKAGAGYLPLDPGYPAARVEYMLEASRADIVLTKEGLLDAGAYSGDRIRMEHDEEWDNDSSPLLPLQTLQDMAYMIFTSGSTGNPKGVVVPQEAVVNFIYGMTGRIPFAEGQTMFSVTTAAFDIFLLETLLPLTQGMRVILATEEEQHSAGALLNSVRDTGAEFMQTTPSRLRLLLMHPMAAESLQRLQILLVGGELFPESLRSQARALTCSRIYNLYGPTETTVWSTVQELTEHKPVTIGTPIANTRVYILDDYMQPLPEGVTGQLWIGGKGVATGYHQSPELTSRKFAGNPFRPGERIFRTGDLAKWRPDGELEVLGREDHQIKIRGYRVELGEIEHQLQTHPAIREAVVVARGEQETAELCAYYVGDAELTVRELRAHLEGLLPPYMLPSEFIVVEAMPLTPNGKIDRKRLPQLEARRAELGAGYAAPSSGTEQEIALLWESLLKREGIGSNDNFFELGGSSILLIQLHMRLQEAFSPQLTVMDCLAHPTVAGLAAFLEQEVPESLVRTEEDKERYRKQEAYWLELLSAPLPFIPFTPDMDAGTRTEPQSSLAYTLPDHLHRTLLRALEEQPFEFTDLLLASFLYVLHLQTGSRELMVEAGGAGIWPAGTGARPGGGFPVRSSLPENNDLGALGLAVAHQRRQAADTDRYAIPRLPVLAVQTGTEPLLLGIVVNDITTGGYSDYDMLLHLEIRSGTVSFLCESGKRRLKKSWMERTMNGYINLLHKIAGQ
ncbi:non-ribosomal peptide synthetase [Paenibacillus tepidiphilus]|uniref:non-ribosomal peptide synthetase n=1 Tax=Paenibacillus tepidiphilus TaxID=2608683 RepID=UPI00123ADAB5|nr:non-ribosomal peptide synthetase [Paenibacillus tepidiphilus]